MSPRRTKVMEMEKIVDDFDAGFDPWDKYEVIFHGKDVTQNTLAGMTDTPSKVARVDFAGDPRGYVDELIRECDKNGF